MWEAVRKENENGKRQTPSGRGSLHLNCLCCFLRDGQGGFPTKGPSERRHRWREGVDLTSHMSGVRVSWVREQQVRRTVSKITFWNSAFCIWECTVSSLASEITVNSDPTIPKPRKELEFRQFENKDRISYRGSFEIRDSLKFSMHTTPQILQVLGKIRSAYSFYRQFLKHTAFEATSSWLHLACGCFLTAGASPQVEVQTSPEIIQRSKLT